MNLMCELGCSHYQIRTVGRLNLTTMNAIMEYSNVSPEDIVEKSNIKDVEDERYGFFITTMCAIGIQCHEIIASNLPQNTPREGMVVTLKWICDRVTNPQIADINQRKLQLYKNRLENAVKKRRNTIPMEEERNKEDSKPPPVVIERE